MEKKILRILSFVMVAMFAFTIMGLTVGAEEWDIPVIEEVTEEEMEEELIEEEFVEALEVTEAEAEAALYDGTTFKAYYASFEDGIEAVKRGTFEATPEIRLLKDVLLDSSPDTRMVSINTGKEFIVNGANPEGGVFMIEDGNKDWNTDKTTEKKTYSIHMEGTGTKLVAKNVTFTRNHHKSYGFFHLGQHAMLELSDNAKIGGTAESYLSGGNGSAVFIEAYGETQSVVAFRMSSDTAVIEYCKGSSYGAVGLFTGKGTVELEKGTIRNCTDGGGALGIRGSKTIKIGKTFKIDNCNVGITVADNAGVKFKFYENTISNCAYGIKVGKNALMETAGSVAITGSTTAGIAANTGGTITLNNIVHIENCDKGIDLASTATLNVNAKAKITDGEYCVYAADGSLIRLNSPITMSGASKEGFALLGEDIIEFGSGFSGNIYVTVGYTSSGKTYDGFWIGHLAEGVESISGKIYHGINGDEYRGVYYKDLMGSGKATVGDKEYTLKSESDGALAEDIPDKAVVFDFPMYVKKGNETDGYKRIAAKTFKDAYSLGSAGETIYLLSDINDNEGISLNATTEVSIDGVKQNVLSHFNFTKSMNINGNGHKITKENSVTKYLFAVYSTAHFNVRNIIFDGNNLGAFAYINPHGGGGTISVDNCIIYNGVGGNAGAFYSIIIDSASTSTAVINIEDTTIANCSAPNGGAIYAYYNTTVNLENVEITGCSTTSPTAGNGAGIYITNGSKLNLKGKINISDNMRGTSENNIYLAGTNQITVTGALTEGSSIGISMSQSGATFGTPAEGVTVDKTAFFADGAIIRYYTGIGEYTERRVNAAFYPETVGDGKLNGTAVINTNVLDTRKASRGANELVLHWPYLVEKDNKLYGYKDINTAMTNGNTKNAVIYLQKDITVEHLVGKAVATNGEYGSVKEYTEFTMTGASSSYAHTDLSGHVTLDGNGHVVDVDKKNGNAIFSIQWGNRSLTLNNFIYDGQKPFAVIHKTAASGNEVINVNNSYMKNVKDYWIFTVGKGGTINITDSTLDGMVDMYGTAATDTAAAFISKFNLSGNTSVNGIGSIKISNAYVEGYINGNYTGNSVISGDVSKVKPGENFTALKTAKSITKAGTSDATFAYYDAETGKFGWTTVEFAGATDSGKYTNGTGLIRFMTTFVKAPVAASVENYGTYATGISNFEGNPEAINAYKKFTTAPTKDEQSYIVDVVNIPENAANESITAISFVKIKGIATPVYYYYAPVNLSSAAKDGIVKELGEKA